MNIRFKVGSNIMHLVRDAVATKSKVFLITDANVYKKAMYTLLPQLDGLNYHIIKVVPGEKSKNFVSAQKIIDAIMAEGPEKNSYIIAFGGGMITDLAGFIASIVLRGINLINIPTSVISQADSSIGGKNGINTEFGKNLLGTIYNPIYTIIDTKLLDTLPQREFVAGYAEILKYSLIYDRKFFFWLENNLEKIINRDPEAVTHAIYTGCKIKKRLAQKDFCDTNGSRALLNFGHTVGHAIESHNAFETISHGEAISLGMVFALQLSEIKSDYQIAINHLKRATLPTNPHEFQTNWNINLLIQKMRRDKKRSHNTINFILLKKIGNAYSIKMPITQLEEYVKKFF